MKPNNTNAKSAVAVQLDRGAPKPRKLRLDEVFARTGGGGDWLRCTDEEPSIRFRISGSPDEIVQLATNRWGQEEYHVQVLDDVGAPRTLVLRKRGAFAIASCLQGLIDGQQDPRRVTLELERRGKGFQTRYYCREAKANGA